MLVLTIVVAVSTACVAGWRLRAAWKDVDARIAAHASLASSDPDRERERV